MAFRHIARPQGETLIDPEQVVEVLGLATLLLPPKTDSAIFAEKGSARLNAPVHDRQTNLTLHRAICDSATTQFFGALAHAELRTTTATTSKFKAANAATQIDFSQLVRNSPIHFTNCQWRHYHARQCN